jgi:colanic acid/amylovoran biosynthesis glycosyltransferase
VKYHPVATAMPAATTVLYLVSQYPKISHTFIRREIHAVEECGVRILRAAIRGWSDELVDPDDIAERERTFYVLQKGALALVMALLSELVRSPRRFLASLGIALRMMRKSDRPRALHLVYLAEACVIAGFCRREGVDHIHAHFGTNPAEVAMLTSGLVGVPYSFTVHGPDEFDCPLYLGLREKIQRAKFVAGISWYTRSQLLRWAAPEDWHKVKVVHCGLDESYAAAVDRPAEKCFQLVSIARLSGQKGQGLLIEAMAEVVRTHPQVRLVLGGDGELRGRIEALIAARGLGENVRISGWLSGAEVKEELLRSRALVLSSFAEGIPVVLMEAMALGRPVLTTCVAGISELVRDGVDGWVYPAGSIEALAQAMRQCLDAEAGEIARMGANARARCLTEHDIRAIGRQLAEAFRIDSDARVPAQ